MTDYIQSYLLPIQHKAVHSVYNFLDEAQSTSCPWLNRLVTPIRISVEVAEALFLPILAIEGAALTAIRLAYQPSLSNVKKLCLYTFTAICASAALTLSFKVAAMFVLYVVFTTYNKNQQATLSDLAKYSGEIAAHPVKPVIQEISYVLEL